MKKENLLVVGLGQCGGTLADNLRTVNKRYTTIYINSSLGDLKNFKFAVLDKNVFIFSGVDGAGKNRSKAKTFISNERIRLASFLAMYSQFKNMLIFTSLGGGTGSGILPDFIRTVKQILPYITINLVAVLPGLDENKLEMGNAINCLKEIEEVGSLINDIKFINNNKRSTYSEINNEAVMDIDAAYGMLGHSKIGSIDEDNLTNVTNCKGYGVVLRLTSNTSNIKAAIEDAIRTSVFEIPRDINGIYGAVNVSEKYSIKEIKSLLEVDETLYITHGNKNVICLGGCDFPDDYIDELEMTLKEKLIKSDNNEPKTFKFNSRYTDNNEAVADKNKAQHSNDAKKVEKSYLDEDDIDKLFDLDTFNY